MVAKGISLYFKIYITLLNSYKYKYNHQYALASAAKVCDILL
jgi:hypothetical protein